ncbi:plasmid pRiA4b ORF-3 family protein [Ferruginibacter lapsinanis]|uniref:plasmid pRiA4b ORF-3 family protein n=1 Tax=Ferruginibacter lapsinanis TaxID=563172 RepID=UPI001E486788|nr:plasmid pRiA4b ORF-3 family protein [Ferruginibacter lapsinanis]UEG48707.1 plasmid pRiA4b ORF-3 family protein [Ferruginibacter lapsinanis]
MAILRFRIYWEDDDSIYRDVVIKHTSNFVDLHEAILKSFEFDTKHKATFYRSNDHWLRGREITLEKYDDREYKVEPLIMADVTLGSEIRDPNQKFVYVYDFNKYWTFMVELINVDKEENRKISYPSCIRTEGIAPSQYGTKGLVDSRLAEVEEKYDLNAAAMLEGFTEEDEDGAVTESEDEDSGAEDVGDEF